MARFSASVQLPVKITRSGRSKPSSSAASSRQALTTRPAHRDSRCPLRPGLAPSFSSVPAMARATCGGLGKLVAALSK